MTRSSDIVILSLILIASIATPISHFTATPETYINSLPYVINSPGNYILNVSCTDLDADYAILINASNVVLDCRGQRLDGVSRWRGRSIWITNVDNVIVYLPEINEWDYGVYAYNCTNLKLIVFKNITNCWTGIRLYKCKMSYVLGIATIKNTGHGINLITCEFCYIINLKTENCWTGIYLSGSRNCTLSNLKFYKCGLFIAPWSPGGNHTVFNCLVNDKSLLYLEGVSNETFNGDYGEIITLKCENVTISGSVISEGSFVETLWCKKITFNKLEIRDLREIAIEHSPEVEFNNCTISDLDYAYTYDSDYFKVINSTITNIYWAFDLHWSNYFSLKNVAFYGCGLSLWYSYHGYVENCTVNDKPLLYLEEVSGGTITGELGQIILVNCEQMNIEVTINTKTAIGIELESCKNCTIVNSVARECRRGIYLLDNELSKVTNCSITSCDQGILLDDSRWCSVIDCTMNNCGNGTDLLWSNYCTIVNCTISNCYWDGIYMYKSHYCNITRCNITDCWRAVVLDRCYNGFIYLNDFVNFYYISIWGGSNYTWYSPELITYYYKGKQFTNYLGNYYSDYDGTDADGDGIGDTPYNKHGVYDPYPLIESQTAYMPAPPKLTLDGLPQVMFTNGVFNVTFVVGSTESHEHTGWGAKTGDVMGAIRIAESFSRVAIDSFVETKLDTEVSTYGSSVIVNWEEISTPAVIVVGGPGVNYITLYYNSSIAFSWLYNGEKSVIYSNLTGNEYKCGIDEEGRRYDYAIIALIKDEESNKTVLIVWGLSKHGTQAACIVLQEYEKYSELLKGKAVIIKWTDTNKNGYADREDQITLVESWE